jgi:hypothetical protein
VPLATVGAGRESAVVEGLRPGTLYSLRVQAVRGEAGSAYTAPASARTFAAGGVRPPEPAYLLAIPVEAGKILLRWQVVPGVSYRLERREGGGPFETLETFDGGPGEWLMDGVEAGVPFTFRVRTFDGAQFSGYSPRAYADLAAPRSPCIAGATTACLLGGRFQVRAWWRDHRADTAGMAGTGALSDQSGTFWFFGPGIVELIVKVLDGRGLTDHFWVFYGALSDVEYWISVTDLETGFVRSYANPAGNLCGIPDTEAIPGDALTGSLSLPVAVPAGGAGAPLAGASCAPDARTLCLLEGRLQVEVAFDAPTGQAGPAMAVPDTDNTGYFWFFHPENIELAVKALDGRLINGHFWVFWGSLSNVRYTVTVTDTESGARRTYTNPQSNFCGGADIEAL